MPGGSWILLGVLLLAGIVWGILALSDWRNRK